MTIPYTLGRIFQNLIFGIAWIAISIGLAILEWPEIGFDGVLWFVIAFLYMAQFYNDQFLHYLVISEDSIKRNSFPRKVMKLEDITRVDNNWGEYIVYTRKSRMKIKLQTVRERAIPQLESYLDELAASKRRSLLADAAKTAIP